MGTIGKIAFSPGGRRAAVVSCVIAMYEAPCRPILPSLHGCLRAHATTSGPSSCSLGPKESQLPCEPPVPRTSTTTCTYPRLTRYVLAEASGASLLYGVCVMITG